MKIPFIKMQSCANDYIYVDNLLGKLNYDWQDLAKKITRRRFSVGGDGLVIIEKSQNADCKMTMFNMDGSLGLMCGNAVRCVAKYYGQKYFVKNVNVETYAGIKEAYVDGDFVCVEMGTAKFDVENTENFYDYEGLKMLKTALFFGYVNVGNPHFAICVKDLKCWDFGHIAPLFTKNKVYGDVNVEVFTCKDKKIECRVLERGSGETFSCGTGASAACALSVFKGAANVGELTVKMRGGNLKVFCDGAFNLTLGGDVKTVYKGEYYD